MNLLLDTHVAIWLLNEPGKIPDNIRHLIQNESEKAFVSHVSLWEIAMKYPLGRNDAPPQSATDTTHDLLASEFPLLPLDLGHILAFERLPILQGDPFDRMLVAQALTENLRFVSHDTRLAAYSDTIICW